MRNTWARAWLAATTLLVAASAIARSRHDTLLRVEEPVMDWLLDGTDTSGWDRASFLSSTWLLITGTVLLALVAFVLNKRVSVAIVLTSVLAFAVATVTRNIVDRPTPLDVAADGELTAGLVGSFPAVELVQTGVFWGLVVLTMWWLGVPRLVWQIGVELAIVISLVVAIRQIVAGEIWPSDAVGAAIVMAVCLIVAAVVFEAFAPRVPWSRRQALAEDPVAA